MPEFHKIIKPNNSFAQRQNRGWPSVLLLSLKRAWIYLLITAVVPCVASGAEALRVLDIEIEWGRGTLAQWDGTLSIDHGSIVKAWNTLLDDGESVEKISERSVAWTSKTAGATDGIGIRVQAALGATLKFQTPAGVHAVSLGDILKKPQHFRQVGRREMVVFQRSSRQTIHVLLQREHLIFSPGEIWILRWELDLAYPLKNRSLSYQVRVTDDQTGAPVGTPATRRIAGDGSSVSRNSEKIHLPMAEGVYSVRINVAHPPVHVPELRIQVVVFDPDRSPEGSPAGKPLKRRLVDMVWAWQIDGDGASRFRGDGTSRILEADGSAYRVTGNRAEKTRKKKDEKRTLNWFAYRLKVDHPGTPHILEITYPTDRQRRFVVSLLENHPPGKTRNAIDIGVVTNAESKRPEGSACRKFVFWPTTQRPAVAFVNTLDGSNAAVESIRLYEVVGGLPARRPDKKRQALHGPYFEEPHLPRTLGGMKVADTKIHGGISKHADWSTFYHATIHMAELVRYQGDNAVMLPVFAYGGTLYPSKLLPNNGRYDDGMCFSDNRHPAQKDVVRLLLKVFERNHLTLVPVFVFYTALPGLDVRFPADEHERREIDLLHRSGKTASEVLSFQNSGHIGPHYNPLNPAVQAEVKAVFHEFIDRYGNSPALGDIALQLNTSGWIQYPGIEWGYDVKTVGRFLISQGETDARKKTALLSDPAAAYAYLTQNDQRVSWIQWRNEKLRDFYGELAIIVSRNNSVRHLALAYMNTFTSRYRDDDPVKAIERGLSAQYLLAVKGVDPLVMAQASNIRIWRPLRTAVPFIKHMERAAAVSHSAEAAALFRRAGADGAVEFLDYFETKLYNLEQHWWWPVDYRMVAMIRPDLEENPPAIQRLDFFFRGGWQIPQ